MDNREGREKERVRRKEGREKKEFMRERKSKGGWKDRDRERE